MAKETKLIRVGKTESAILEIIAANNSQTMADAFQQMLRDSLGSRKFEQLVQLVEEKEKTVSDIDGRVIDVLLEEDEEENNVAVA